MRLYGPFQVPAGGLLEEPDPSPPYLWSDWHCTESPRMWISRCPACRAELWLHWTGERWQVSCAEGCTREQIDAGWQLVVERERQRLLYEEEARATMDPDDQFYGVPAVHYIHALTGQEDTRGWFRCPFHADGQERTPSLHATDFFWYCHACHKGGTVYDFGAELWGIEPRKAGFAELRDRLYRELVA